MSKANIPDGYEKTVKLKTSNKTIHISHILQWARSEKVVLLGALKSGR